MRSVAAYLEGSVVEGPRHWHVTVTLAGAPVEPLLLRSSLVRFAEQRMFLSSLRFLSDRVELSYWDEGRSMAEVASLAMRVWSEHRVSAGLPQWEVVGLEVLDRETYRDRPPLDSGSLSGAQEIHLSI